MKMADFEEKFDGKEGVMVETSDGVSEVRTQYCLGVSKQGDKWRARVRHPKLKFDVYLGSYIRYEEAAFAVKKKKAEFEEMLKGEDGMSVDSCKDDFEVSKLPFGVYRTGRESWCARLWHPKLMKDVSFGEYESVEEAAAVVNKKLAEFRKMYWWKGRRGSFGADCKDDDDDVLEKPESESTSRCKPRKARVRPDYKDDEVLGNPESKLISTSKWLDEQTGDVKVPRGVRKVKSGKWVARINNPMTKSRIWLGSYNTVEEAVKSFNKKKALLAAERKRAENNEWELRHRERAVSEAVPGFGYEPQTPDKEELKSISVDEKSKYGVIDVSCKLEYEFVHSSPISAMEPEISSKADVSDKTILSQEPWRETACSCDFDEAVSLGFINEYGQLLGMYSELDEPMGL